jgi:hypothetical protein
LTIGALKVENMLMKEAQALFKANPNTGGKLDGQSGRNRFRNN